jgi:molybdate transport system substrate-binding protein
MQKLNAATAVTAAFSGLTIAAGLSAAGLSAAELKILSAGAVQPGLNAAAKSFFDKTGDSVKIAYDPANVLGKRVAGGEVADIIVSSPAVVAELTKTARVLPGGQVPLGKVGVGVVVREGAPAPDISSTQALKKALLDAEAVAYNTASSGAYIENMLKKIGVFDEIQGKLVRLFDGNAVMRRLVEGKGREFGFGGITDILLNRDKGVRLVGPLPAEIQNYTNYIAALIATSPDAESARAFMAYLASRDGRALFAANGISE